VDGRLKFGEGDGPKTRLTALSETTFVGAGEMGVPVEFVRNDNGEITHVVIITAQYGELRGKRKK
jgi:hypothetical protein